jgi:hypothetical protein
VTCEVAKNTFDSRCGRNDDIGSRSGFYSHEGDDRVISNPERYSDRDRLKATKNDKEKLEQALKTGEEKAFYRRELEKMGWKITSVNYDKPDYVEYEIVKDDTSYEVQIDIDKNSRKATKVDVAYNAWQTDATERALRQTSPRR